MVRFIDNQFLSEFSLNGIKDRFIDVIENEENKINRITKAALPYLNFCPSLAPLDQLVLIGENAQHAYCDLTHALKNYKENQASSTVCWHAGRGLLELAIVINSVAFHSLGAALSSVLDMANEIYELQSLIHKKQCKRSDLGIFLYKFTLYSLELGALVCAAPEVLVASVALRIFLEMGQSYQEYQQGRYIEAVAKLGLAIIRSHQIAPQVKGLYDKWITEIYLPLEQCSFFTSLKVTEGIERRAVVDVGSGGTKVLIVDIDTRTNEIVNTVFENSFSVPYQASLEKSVDNQFDSAVCEQGLKTFQQIQDLLNQHQVQKVSAIATEAFRKASNGESFAKKIQDLTKIPLRIISQQEEGVIAFNSALAVSKVDKKKVVVWDIGTGSFQMTTLSDENDHEVFTGGLGSVPFKNYIIDQIQGKDSDLTNTPNPISEEDYKSIGRFARKLARQAARDLKSKINSYDVTIVGIGRLFRSSVLPNVSEGETINRKGLRNFIRASLNKNDKDFKDPFAHVDVPNCIQVLECMKALHIHEIAVVDTTSTKGLAIGAEKDFAVWGNNHS
jgi:exopolyphosphatase / guanosine-5'-triphosphate,3'-diphosphate pyrophosphatase